MLDPVLSDPSLVAIYGLAVIAVLLTPLAHYFGYRRGRQGKLDAVSGAAAETLTFQDVCEAVARAKTDRQRQGVLSDEYVSGADGVMLELMVEHDLSVEAQRMAVLAGGIEVELETDASNPLARNGSGDDGPDYHPPDGPGDGGVQT